MSRQVPGKKHGRRRKRNRLFYIYLTAILLIVISTGAYIGVTYFMPNFKVVELYDYYPELDRDEAYIVLERELLDEGTPPVVENGEFYLPVDFVKAYLDRYIFWEPETGKLIITATDEVIRMKAGEKQYTVNGRPASLEPPVIRRGETAYLPEALLAERYQAEFGFDESFKMVTVDRADQGRNLGAVAAKKADMRYEPDKKSPIEKKLVNGEHFVMYGETDGYTLIRTGDGLLGYVRSKDITETEVIPPAAVDKPDTSVPSAPFDGKISLVWDQISNVEGNARESKRVRHAGLDVLSPTWFSVEDTAGTLADRADAAYVSWAHENGMSVWALVSDGFKEEFNHAILTDSDVRKRVIDQLLTFVDKYGLDGINIDFECLYKSADAGYYLQFFRELYPLMRERGAVLSADIVVPQPYNMFYNRAEVSKTVDYICVMTYDEHTSVSETSGPVASLGFVEDGVTQTLNEVPREKLIMGLPYYVRVWEEADGQTKPSIRGNYSMQYAYDYFIENGAEFVWDAEIGSYCAEFTEKAEGGDITCKVWLEDERSIEEKLKIFEEYDLAGTAGWSRGMETAGVWELLNAYLD